MQDANKQRLRFALALFSQSLGIMVLYTSRRGFATTKNSTFKQNGTPTIFNFGFHFLTVKIGANSLVTCRKRDLPFELPAKSTEKLMRGKKVFTTDFAKQNTCHKYLFWWDCYPLWDMHKPAGKFPWAYYFRIRENIGKKRIYNALLLFCEWF